MRKRSVVRVAGFAGASAVLVVLAVGAATLALALWSSVTGTSGRSKSQAMTLTAGNVPVVSSPSTTPTVNVSWVAVSVGAPVSGYEVRAFNATNGVARSVGGGCAGIVTGTSCTDVGAPDGSWKYSVAARQQLWSGAQSARSTAVAVDASSRSLVVADGPVGYWRLGESSGTTAVDEMGLSNGTYTGGYTLGSPGALVSDPNTAVDLDGISGRVTVPSVAALQLTGPFSLEAWVNSDSTAITQWIVNKGTQYYLYITNSQVVFGVNNGIYAYVGTPVGPVGVWQHFVGTYDGAALRLYRNGVLVSQAALTGAFLSSTAPLIFGSQDAAGGGPLDGRVDEVAVYGSALTAAKVLAHYQRARPVQVTFPVAGSQYGNALWDAGCAGRVCGTTTAERGISTMAVSVRQGSGNYWNGSAFASATEVLLPATGTTSWALSFPATNFPAEGSYTVRAVGTDVRGATYADASPLIIERTAPTVTLLSPAAGYNDATWNSACNSTVCGYYSDAGSGIASVGVSLRQGTGNYWNGAAFASAAEVLLPATIHVDGYWYLPFPGATFPAEGSYAGRAVATDRAGNTSTAAATFLIDRTLPTVAITFPVASASYTGLTWDAGCASGICGTAGDAGTGIAGNALNIQQVSTGNYWSGTSFASPTAVTISATGTTTWSLPFPSANYLATGTYFVVAATIDGAGNLAFINMTFTVNRTPPAVAVTFPAAAAAYTDATWDAGCTSKICGTAAAGATPVGSVAVSVRQGSGNYWNGTAFASATEVMVAATGTTSWTLSFGHANFLADGSYTVRARATGTDALTTSASTTFTIDRIVPTVATTFPVAAGIYGTTSWNAGCTSKICGTAADTGSGVASVKVSVRQATGSLYWNGTAFASASEVLTTATGTTSWSLPFAAANLLADGTYTVRTLVTDNAALTATTSTAFTRDTVAPAPTASALSNANGLVTPGTDELKVTFSEALDLSTICSAWTGTVDQSLGGAGVVVNFSNATPDILTVTASGCTIGTLSAGNYMTVSGTFGGSTVGTESRITWTAATKILTIHIGGLLTGTASTTSVGLGSVTYTPSAALKDLAGNPVATAGVVTANQHF